MGELQKKPHCSGHKVDERDNLLGFALSRKSLSVVTQVVGQKGTEQMPISYKATYIPVTSQTDGNTWSSPGRTR